MYISYSEECEQSGLPNLTGNTIILVTMQGCQFTKLVEIQLLCTLSTGTASS
jgi:hypothetical protein